jgi:hypothetical protein
VPSAAARAERGVHWGAALSIAFAALVTLAWAPWALTEAAPADPPEAAQGRVVPEPLAGVVPAVAVVPAMAVVTPVVDAPGPGAVELSAAAMPPDLAPAPVAIMVERDKPSRSAKARPAKRLLSATAATAATTARDSPGVCSGDAAGLLTRTLCVLNPCRDPAGRHGAKCLDRQRAEEARLRRMASLG